MNIIDILKTASSNLMRNKGRTLLTIVAIFIGSFTIAITTGINIGVNDYIDKQIGSIGGENQLLIKPKQEQQMNPSKNEPAEYTGKNEAEMKYLNTKNIKELKEMKEIEKVEPFLFLSADYVQGKNDKKFLLSATSSSELKVDLKAGRQVKADADEYEIDIAPEYVKSLGFSSSKEALNKVIKIAVSSQASQQQEIIEAKIVGVRNTSIIQGGQSIVNHSLANKILTINELGMPEEMKNQYPYISAEMDHSLTEKQVESLKRKLFDKGYEASTVDDEIGMIRNVINAITGVLIMFGVIALIAASFGIINTLYMSVQDRTREIGLMKAMGLSGFKIFLTFSFEALLIGFWGAFLGILAAHGLGGVINHIAKDSFLDMLEGFTLVQFNAGTSLLIIGVIMLIAFLAGTLPANRAARLDPIEALRYE